MKRNNSLDFAIVRWWNPKEGRFELRRAYTLPSGAKTYRKLDEDTYLRLAFESMLKRMKEGK